MQDQESNTHNPAVSQCKVCNGARRDRGPDIWRKSAFWRAIYFESLARGLGLSEACRRADAGETKIAAPRPTPLSIPRSGTA